MADIIRLHQSPHEQAQLLLPWHVNGTLDAEEAAIVEAHIAECAECRLDAEVERELSREVANLSIDVERDWAALAGRLEAARKPPAITFLRRRVAVGWVLAGQLATAAALVLAIYASPPAQEPAKIYHALGSSKESTAGNVVVVFQPNSGEGDMRAALRGVGASIVGGPNASGAYVLRVPQSKRPAALGRLRAMPQVMLAEPIDSGTER